MKKTELIDLEPVSRRWMPARRSVCCPECGFEMLESEHGHYYCQSCDQHYEDRE